MRWRPAIGAAAMLLAACGSGTTRTAETTRSPQTRGPVPATDSTPPDGPAAAVPEFLDFTAETVRGEQVSGADYAGRDLVLWFWAPW